MPGPARAAGSAPLYRASGDGGVGPELRGQVTGAKARYKDPVTGLGFDGPESFGEAPPSDRGPPGRQKRLNVLSQPRYGSSAACQR